MYLFAGKPLLSNILLRQRFIIDLLQETSFERRLHHTVRQAHSEMVGISSFSPTGVKVRILYLLAAGIIMSVMLSRSQLTAPKRLPLVIECVELSIATNMTCRNPLNATDFTRHIYAVICLVFHSDNAIEK